jgi:NAD(P)-dependent dehydrogenase (short-subunit alcohol dehydrogenase family)
MFYLNPHAEAITDIVFSTVLCLIFPNNPLVCIVDHLVNNAGLANVCWFEEVPNVADLKQVLVLYIHQSLLLMLICSSYSSVLPDMFVLQDVNFWGTVHPTHAALPHLKNSGGKIFVNSSAAALLAMPRMSFYNVHFPRQFTSFPLLSVQTCLYFKVRPLMHVGSWHRCRLARLLC